MKRIKTKTRKNVSACFLFAFLFVAITLSFGGSGVVRAFADNADERAEITVTAGSKRYVYRDVILPAPDHTVYEQIERRNINAPLGEKIKTVDKCLAAGAEWSAAIGYAFPRLTAFVDKIESEIKADPVNSEIKFYPNRKPMFVISRAREGRIADVKRLYQDIYLALKKGAKARVNLKTIGIAPDVTESDNAKLTDKISEFSTSFSSSADGRKNNIRLAVSKINGTVLGAGEEFSFNGKVGARTEKNGFSVAKIIVAGEYTEGVGGGVCQVSTTLYNAALTAGMKVTSVRNHTIAPSYVSPSLDAMVNASSSDLKFVNPYDTPVFIKAESANDIAKITFYGLKPEYSIKAISRVISRTEVPEDKVVVDSEHKFIPADSPAGARVRVSYGHAGVKSEAYLRYFSRQGRLIREEKIRSDSYAKTQGIVAVSPDKPSAENASIMPETT